MENYVRLKHLNFEESNTFLMEQTQYKTWTLMNPAKWVLRPQLIRTLKVTKLPMHELVLEIQASIQ